MYRAGLRERVVLQRARIRMMQMGILEAGSR